MAIVGAVPTVAIDKAISVPTVPVRIIRRIGMFIEGQAPTVTSGAQQEAPTTGSMVISGQTPSAEIDHIRAVDTATMVIAGKQPTVNHLVSVGTGSLAISSDAVTLGVTANPGTGSLSISGQTPSLLGQFVPGTGSMVIASAAPSAEIDHIRAVSTGSLSIDPQGTTRLLNHIASPATATITISSDVVTVAVDQTELPSLADVVITGQPVTVVIAGDFTSKPLLGTMALLGQSIAEVRIDAWGTRVENDDATTDVPNQYEQCDLTGFRQLPGSMKLTWNKYAVRKKSYDERHPATMQQSGHTDRWKGAQKPEQDDRFLEDNEVTADDL